MSKEELIEALADKEHESWAGWMDYLLESAAISTSQDVTSLSFPTERVEHWRRQIKTPYAELSEQEKESDRKEVRKILPIIEKYIDFSY